MNLIGNERLLDKLAAEYVLGTMKGGARRRFEALLQQEPQVRRITAQWQDRLHPLAQFSPDVTPSPQLWQSIAGRLKLGVATPAVPRQSFWQNLRDDLAFWRGLGMASTALATILIAVLATRAPIVGSGSLPAVATTATTATTAPLATGNGAPQLSYVAMLADERAQPVAVVTGDETNHRLTVRLVLAQTVAADRSLELWAVPKSGAPRSLGLVAASGSVTLQLPADTTPQTVSLLAISLEPKGGSPNRNAPTGPIVYKGAWLSI